MAVVTLIPVQVNHGDGTIRSHLGAGLHEAQVHKLVPQLATGTQGSPCRAGSHIESESRFVIGHKRDPKRTTIRLTLLIPERNSRREG